MCTVWGVCVERCCFGAISGGDGDIRFEAEKCFGCGLCAGTCPGGAQVLVEK